MEYEYATSCLVDPYFQFALHKIFCGVPKSNNHGYKNIGVNSCLLVVNKEYLWSYILKAISIIRRRPLKPWLTCFVARISTASNWFWLTKRKETVNKKSFFANGGVFFLDLLSYRRLFALSCKSLVISFFVLISAGYYGFKVEELTLLPRQHLP